MTRLTRVDTRAEADRLERAGYRPPEHGAAAAADLWADVLAELSPTSFHEAVTRWMLIGSHYWPVPSQLLSLARLAEQEQQGARRLSTSTPDLDAPCPVCGAVLEELPPEKVGGSRPRFGTFHDVQKHVAAGVPWVGYPLQTSDGGGPEANDKAVSGLSKLQVHR